jgi:hypothetical protein
MVPISSSSVLSSYPFYHPSGPDLGVALGAHGDPFYRSLGRHGGLLLCQGNPVLLFEGQNSAKEFFLNNKIPF